MSALITREAYERVERTHVSQVQSFVAKGNYYIGGGGGIGEE